MIKLTMIKSKIILEKTTRCNSGWDGMCLSRNVMWFPVLEDNPVFFEIVIALTTLLLSAITIIISINIYHKQKRIEAQFGFYMNILVFLERLNLMISRHKEIFQLFFDEETRKKKFVCQIIRQRSDIIVPKFKNFCKEFLEYLSETDNNVPPVKTCILRRCVTYNRQKWYKDILTLTRFLHNVNMLGELFFYTSEDQYEEYVVEVKKFKEAITRIRQSICERLKLDYSLNDGTNTQGG
jgi:hypothetical protein